MARTKGIISQEILLKLKDLNQISFSHSQSRLWPEVFQTLFASTSDVPLNRRAVKDAFYYLKRKKLVQGKIDQGQLRLFLTPAGQTEAEKYRINDLQVKTPKSWDTKWRFLVLDFSKMSLKQKTTVLKKMKQWKFFPVMKSVWVFPYPCVQEINKLKDLLGLENQSCWFLNVVKPGNETILRQAFKLDKKRN